MGSIAVYLQRQHTADGAVEVWNGSSWVRGDYNWKSSIATPNSDHTSAWSVNIPWPTGANLPNGRYTIFVKSYDKAGNRTDIVRSVLIGPSDTTVPALAIATPANNYLIDSAQEALTSINGTVSDVGGSGVAYVQVKIARSWQGVASSEIQTWDGTAWSLRGTGFYFAATLGAPDATGTSNWSLSAPLPPPAQLTTGEYSITVLAYDRHGNRGVAQHQLHVAPYDDIAPTISVTFPAEGQRLYSLPEIRGTSADEGSGVSDVRVTLRRFLPVTGGTRTEYWSGTAWSANSSYSDILPSRTDTGWTRNQNLPSGAELAPAQYRITAKALDRYSNVGTVYRDFNIIAIPPLSMDAHIRATESQPWLGEGFSNSDASGQTLGGTIASGETQTRRLRLKRSGGLDSKTVRVTIPDWAAFAAAGWTASFTERSSDVDITAQITSAQGWQTVFSDGEAKQFRADVRAPANASAGQTSALTFRVEADPTSETSALDVVKATWRVTAPAPDLAIRAENGSWQGENVRNSDGTGQIIERVAASGHVVRGQIKLAVADASDGQTVTWSVPDWDAFRADGWSAKFFDATNGNTEITGQLTGEGWTTQHTNGYEAVIAWEVTVPTGASNMTRAWSVRAQVGGASDVVKASVRVLPIVPPYSGDQSIAGTEYSLDGGVTWVTTPTTGTITVPQWSSIGIRASKGNPALEWPSTPFKPAWNSNGVTHWGEKIFLYFPEATPVGGSDQTAQVECGNVVTLRFRVQADE